MRLLLAATPLAGHVGPLTSIGRALVDRGHQVTLLTGVGSVPAADGRGLELVELPADADFRRRAPGRVRRLRVTQGREQILETFVRPLSAQHRVLTGVLAEGGWDAVVCDTAYLGALPLLLSAPPGRRIPVLGVSVTPLALTSVDSAPFGSALQPGGSAGSRRRNQRIQWLLRHGPLRPLHAEMDEVLAGYGVPGGTVDYFDVAGLFDRTFHLAPPEFEYPRRELPPTVRLVGPLPAQASSGRLPSWWDDLQTGLPVVHVTQGTMDNHDPGKLILPTVRALAGEPVLTVVSTGGLPVPDLRAAHGDPLPANVRVAELLPYARLLPRTAVVVSNGGFGGVLQSLAHGIPLVVAGDTEDKPEVAARVRRTGAGLDLRTGRPSPQRLRAAVRTVLTNPSYRREAVLMGHAIARLGDPRTTIADEVEACVSLSRPRR